MEYVIDTHALKVRLAIDGRTHGLIARDAKLPVGIIDDVLNAGKAEKDVIEKIRLAIKPSMRFGTICPPAMQKNEKDPRINLLRDPELKKEIKRTLELERKLVALCDEYTAIDVFSMIQEWVSNILLFLTESGFDLMELVDEAAESNPCGGCFDLDEKGEVIYKGESKS